MRNLLQQKEEQIKRLTEQLQSIQQQNIRIKEEKQELQSAHDILMKDFEDLLKNYEQKQKKGQIDLNNNKVSEVEIKTQIKQKQVDTSRLQQKYKLRELTQVMELKKQINKMARKMITVEELWKKQYKQLQEKNMSLENQIKKYKEQEQKEIINFQLSKTVFKTRNNLSVMKQVRKKQLITISICQIVQFIRFYLGKLENDASKIQAIYAIGRFLEKERKN